MSRKSFTLLELVLVIVVIGIIALFAIPGYFGVKTRAEERQASIQLRLIHTTEKVKKLENNLYVACSGFAACNTALNLDLPDDDWTYTVVCTGGCDADFTATAINSADTCTYTITKDTPMIGSAGCTFDP